MKQTPKLSLLVVGALVAALNAEAQEDPGDSLVVDSMSVADDILGGSRTTGIVSESSPPEPSA